MHDFDTNAEWHRLNEVYAAMTEEELDAVAGEAYELTDIGKQVLEAEISRRGLDIELRKQPVNAEESQTPPEGTGDSAPSEEELVELFRVWDLDEAKRVKNYLNSAGVACYLGPESVDDIGLLHASFENGVALKVRDVDQQRANAALSRFPKNSPKESAKDQEEYEYAARCPRCHSTEIVFQSLDLDPKTESAFDSKFNWSCEAYGYQWKDDGIESET